MLPLNNICPVILCGGGGKRLWPLSTDAMPKQFHRLHSKHSLLQMTVLRAMAVTGSAPVLVTNAEHVARVAEQLAEVNIEPACIIAEPTGRNTAPGIALAARWLRRDRGNSLMWVLPSDHHIGELEPLIIAVRDAAHAAAEGSLVTFGIEPTTPHTGYGYIRRGVQVDGYSKMYRVAGFREKPALENATAYVESGQYYWNSGMFLFAADTYLNELGQYAEDVFDNTHRSFKTGRYHSGRFYPSARFEECPAISIDYAVMEPTRNAVVVPLSADWSDIGSWGSIWEISEKSGEGNHGGADSLFVEARNNLVRSDMTVAVVGVSDIVVVEANGALLICDRHQSENVKQVQALLKERDGRSAAPPPAAARPAQDPAPENQGVEAILQSHSSVGGNFS